MHQSLFFEKQLPITFKKNFDILFIAIYHSDHIEKSFTCWNS